MTLNLGSEQRGDYQVRTDEGMPTNPLSENQAIGFANIANRLGMHHFAEFILGLGGVKLQSVEEAAKLPVTMLEESQKN